MFIVIGGGGKIGYYLAKTLMSFKHDITVIEKQKELCKRIANDLEITVINGDSTDLDKLSEAGAKKADVFIAVTGRDEDNLISCQLAKRNFGIRRTIARVNNPKNISVFKKLGVDTAVSSTSIIADLIEQEVDYVGMKTLLTLRDGQITLTEILISEKSVVNGKTLKEIDIPKDCIVISVIRGEEVIIPNAFTVIKEGDYVLTVTSLQDQHELMRYFL